MVTPTDTPTTYRFTWDAPTAINGELVRYVLSCDPPGFGSGATSVSDTYGPTVTDVNLEGLDFNVKYTCSVRARNAATLQSGYP